MTDFDRSDEVREMWEEDQRAADDHAAGAQQRRSAAALLVDMALADYELGVSDTDDPFGIRRDKPHLAMPLRGGKTGLRVDLARKYFELNNTVPGAQALADALTVLEGKAAHCAPRKLFLRVGTAGAAVYIDTGDVDGTVIEISGGSWRTATTAPVLFRRTRLTSALAVPQPGGDLQRLWDFAAITEENRPLVLAWLVSALTQPMTPHAILELIGEQGTAKSSTTRVLVDLVDPSPVPLRQAPRNADEWVTAASASWVVALDNLSSIQDWLSDALCRAATGDGSVKRALYTDADVAVLAFLRCVIVNGIELGGLRGDLAERLVVADLERIDPSGRRTEAALADEWAQAKPLILGALLDLAATVHHRLPAVTLSPSPRMADFAKVLHVVDDQLGTNGLAHYSGRYDRLAMESVLEDPFTARLVELGFTCEGKSAREIAAAMRPQSDKWKPPADWPKTARAVSGTLTRNAPSLRRLGWMVSNDQARNHDKVMRWTLTPPESTGKTSPHPTQSPSQQVDEPPERGHTGNPSPSPRGTNPHSRGAKSATPQPDTPLTSGDEGDGECGDEIHVSSGQGLCTVCGEGLPAGMAMHHDCARLQSERDGVLL